MRSIKGAEQEEPTRAHPKHNKALQPFQHPRLYAGFGKLRLNRLDKAACLENKWTLMDLESITLTSFGLLWRASLVFSASGLPGARFVKLVLLWLFGNKF